MDGEGAPLHLVLVAHRLAPQGEPVAIEGGAPAPQVLLEGQAHHLVRGEAEGGEAGAQRRREAQLLVRRPQHRGHLPDRQAQPGLALPERVLGVLRLDRGGDLAADEDEEVALLGPEADRGVVGLDRRHPDRLAARDERRSQPVHRVAGDELHLAALDEGAEDLRGGEERLAGAEHVLGQSPPGRLGRRRRVALVGEVGEAQQPRPAVLRGRCRSSSRGAPRPGSRGSSGRAPGGPTPSGRPRRCGTRRAWARSRRRASAAACTCFSRSPSRSQATRARPRTAVATRSNVIRNGSRETLRRRGAEAQPEVGELVGGVQEEGETGQGAADARQGPPPREDREGGGQVGEPGHEAPHADRPRARSSRRWRAATETSPAAAAAPSDEPHRAAWRRPLPARAPRRRGGARPAWR